MFRLKFRILRVHVLVSTAQSIRAIAVEIESRVFKQVRGAILDLMEHPYPKKLLILIPAHLVSPPVNADQCRMILEKRCGSRNSRVVLLTGTGHLPNLETDATLVRSAVTELQQIAVATLA